MYKEITEAHFFRMDLVFSQERQRNLRFSRNGIYSFKQPLSGSCQVPIHIPGLLCRCLLWALASFWLLRHPLGQLNPSWLEGSLRNWDFYSPLGKECLDETALCIWVTSVYSLKWEQRQKPSDSWLPWEGQFLVSAWLSNSPWSFNQTLI